MRKRDRPDIIDVGDQQSMWSLVQAGILLDLTDYAEPLGLGPAATHPTVADALSVQGRQYRFPCNVWANCVIRSLAIFDDHDVPYPQDGWTCRDFIAIAERLRDMPSKSGRERRVVWLDEASRVDARRVGTPQVR